MNSKVIKMPEIGEIILQKSRRNNRLRLTINSRGKVRVSFPVRCEFKQAEDFVNNHMEWIAKNLEKVKTRKAPEDSKPENALFHADVYLPERLEFLSRKTGIEYSKLKLVNVKSYWGKCMYDNTISLNIQLMRLPEELIDYVILHELAHVRVKNHSRKFYEFLETLIPEPRRRSKDLKNYSLVNYLR